MAEIDRQYVDVDCPTCGWQRSCNDALMVEMLRAIRKLSVRKAPSGSILIEIFRDSLSQMPCPGCQHTGLRETVADEGDDWQEVKQCETCGKPIEWERLSVLPDATRCVACQRADEKGEPAADQEYCERCGAPMKIVTSRGPGISRYVLRCSRGCR